MKRSRRPQRKSPKKSPKKYSKKKTKKSSVKKHRIIKLVEPIREDVEKIVKKSGYGFIKTALVTAAVAALIAAGANKYDIDPITKMVAPYVDNNLPQVDIHGIINTTVQNFPEVNVDKFHNILSKVDSTDISSIASKNMKDSVKNIKSFEKPTLRDLLIYKTIKLEPGDKVFIVIPAYNNKERQLIPIDNYMKNEAKYWEGFEDNLELTLNPEIVIKKAPLRYEGPYYGNRYENIAENLYRGTSNYIRNEENFDKFFKTKKVSPKPKKEYTLEEYIQSIRKFNDNNVRRF